MEIRTSTKTARAYVTTATTAPAYWMIGVLWRVIPTGIQTGGSFCMLDQLCSAGSGPTRHDHPQDEGLYVLDGSVSFQPGGATFSAGPGSFVAVPRHTEHSFVVEEQAKLINFYLPAGFEMFLMGGAAPAMANTLPPADLPMPPHELLVKLSEDYGGMPLTRERSTRPNPDAIAQPLVAHAATADASWYEGCRWSVLADGSTTGGSYCLFEVSVEQGQGIALHLREGVDEVHCLLEGEVEVQLDGHQKAMRAGAVSFAPRGTATSFRAKSATARLLVIHTAPGFERVLKAFGTGMPGTTTPVKQPTGDDKRVSDLLAEVGWCPLNVVALKSR